MDWNLKKPNINLLEDLAVLSWTPNKRFYVDKKHKGDKGNCNASQKTQKTEITELQKQRKQKIVFSKNRCWTPDRSN